MSYESVTENVKRLIEANAPSIGAIRVSIGDYDIMNESAAGVVIIDYSSLDGERAEFGASYFNTWNLELTVAVPFNYSRQAHDDIAALRSYLLESLGSNPELDNTVESLLVSRGESIPQTFDAGGQTWQIELMTVRIREIVEY